MINRGSLLTIKKEYFLEALICIALIILSVVIHYEPLSAVTTFVVYIVLIIEILKINENRVTPFFFLVVYCFASNAGQTLTNFLGFECSLNVDIYRQYSINEIIEMLNFQNVFVFFMGFTYIVYKQNHRLDFAYKNAFDNELKIHQSSLIDDVIMLAFFSVMLVVLVIEFSKRSVLSYGEYYYSTRTGVSTYVGYAFYVYWFYYIKMNAGTKRRIAIVATIFIMILNVFIGSRSNIIIPLVGLVYLYNKKEITNKRKVWKFVAIGIVILYVLSGFISLRDYSINELNLSVIMSAYIDKPINVIAQIIQECGGSARTIIVSMNAIKSNVIAPQNTILYYLAKGFAPTSIINLIIGSLKIPALSSWITEYGGSLSGWGFSMIAEAYVNFGEVGCVIYPVFIGYIYGMLENRINITWNKGKRLLAMGILYILAYGVFQARAELALMSTCIRYTFYIAIIYWLPKTIRNHVN